MHPIFRAFLSQTAEGGPFGSLGSFLPIILMIGVLYFVLLRPQGKERKKVEQFRQNMKKGDRVWTQGGLVGIIVQVEDQAVLLDLGGGTKVRVLKTFVGGEWQEKPAAGEPAKVEAKK